MNLTSKIIFKKYLSPVMSKLIPKLKMLRSSCLIFQVFRSHLQYLIMFHWTFTTNYAEIGLRVWIPISIIKCKVIFMKYVVQKPATLLKVTLLYRCFSRFLIVQMIPNRVKHLILWEQWPWTPETNMFQFIIKKMILPFR